MLLKPMGEFWNMFWSLHLIWRFPILREKNKRRDHRTVWNRDLFNRTNSLNGTNFTVSSLKGQDIGLDFLKMPKRSGTDSLSWRWGGSERKSSSQEVVGSLARLVRERGRGQGKNGGEEGERESSDFAEVEREEEVWLQQSGAIFCSNCSSNLLMEEMDEFNETLSEEDKAELEAVSMGALEGDQLADREVHIVPMLEDMHNYIRRLEKGQLRDREEGDLLRAGLPLCIYEPYSGEGAWPFLHQHQILYRGLCLDSKSSLHTADDLLASERLSVLQNPFDRNNLCEVGGMFSVAFHIDRIHKQPYIGFQPWQATAQNVVLSEEAERSLWLETDKGQYGDALFFWSPSKDLPGTMFRTFPRGSMRGFSQEESITNERKETVGEDFWSTCDALNAGKCREAFLVAFRGVYGLPRSWKKLPPMPSDGGTWASMNCWVLPTASFVEFITFARLFVDALDSKYTKNYEDQGVCPFSRNQIETFHCSCRMVERLINVWAYHSGRRFVHVNRTTGLLTEHHPVVRRGQKMWRKFFLRRTLKSIDEDWAEITEEEPEVMKNRLWPLTGEVWWKGASIRVKKAREERVKLKRLKEIKNDVNRKQKTVGKFLYAVPKDGRFKGVPRQFSSVGKESEVDKRISFSGNQSLLLTESR